MPYETDQRLKSYLDSNQLHREQMCLAILSLDKRFSEVRPRHPRGGPDGGRDIEATYRKALLSFAAVGFLNQGEDTPENKKQIQRKFSDDLASALTAEPQPAVFVFLTNLNLTISEKQGLIDEAKRGGVVECEIFDRERIRIALDSADGFSIRFQFLGIPLSDSEQASFFARWGDDINALVSTGFQSIHKTLDHLLFLQESGNPIEGFFMRFELDREYTGDEIGHFRAFCSIYLHQLPLNILSILFGSTDRSERGRDDFNPSTSPTGAAHSLALGQWQQKLEVGKDDESDMREENPEEPEREKYEASRAGSSIGIKKTKFLTIRYYTSHFLRLEPELELRNFNGAWILPIMNARLAKAVRRFELYSNGYLLMEVDSSQVLIDESPFSATVPFPFTTEELADAWVRVRPKTSSSFVLDFTGRVPVRLFESGLAGTPPITKPKIGTDY